MREIIRDAERRRSVEGRGTILFCDEIHRFNKAQQDAFLPSVEQGVITLIGATTENPSFELNSALLSRVRVFVLEPLEPQAIRSIIERGLARLAADAQRAERPELSPEALDLLVRHADGDARRALNATEALWEHLQIDAAVAEPISAEIVAGVLERRMALYDKSGEQHYNLISRAAQGRARQRRRRRAVLVRAHGRRRRRRAVHRATRRADGGRGYRPRGSARADHRARGEGRVRLLGLARRGACDRRGVDLSRDGAEEQQSVCRVGRGAASGARLSGRARAAAHSQRAHAVS